MTNARLAAHPGNGAIPGWRGGLRLGLFVMALAGCSSPEDACPGQPALSCSTEQSGLRCNYESEGRPYMCRCSASAWTCTDCPGGEFPRDRCATGATCSVWGFENACACSCDASGAWTCSVDDPNPNFHCSFQGRSEASADQVLANMRNDV